VLDARDLASRRLDSQSGLRPDEAQVLLVGASTGGRRPTAMLACGARRQRCSLAVLADSDARAIVERERCVDLARPRARFRARRGESRRRRGEGRSTR
jgi:hypothetical protein